MVTTGNATGNAFVWRASTLVCLMLNQQGKYHESLTRLEDILQKQKRYFGLEIHASYEYTLGQLAQTAIRIGDRATNDERKLYLHKAELAYEELLNCRKQIYGEFYEGSLASLLSLTSLLGALMKDDEAIERCKEAFNICEFLLTQDREDRKV